jgi:SAM-dependent methyltransferase
VANNTHSDQMPRDRWEVRYVEDDIPWDTGVPDAHLQQVVGTYITTPRRILEIGCGTGTNAIWLAERGHNVFGIDLSPTAIEAAEEKARTASIDCRFETADFLAEPTDTGPFDLVYDRGCFHVFAEDDVRAKFAEKVADSLSPNGIWHSLLGSTDGPPRDAGPPRRSAREVVAAIEPRFEILELRSTSFDAERHAGARAWVLVARRRT